MQVDHPNGTIPRLPVPEVFDEPAMIERARSLETPLAESLRLIAALAFHPRGRYCQDDDFQQRLLMAAKALEAQEPL